MDRNLQGGVDGHRRGKSPSSRRAWIEITITSGCVAAVGKSPSSRRAWIEISAWSYPGAAFGSPSSRRAWIEIPMRWKRRSRPSVALLAEGVDRNYPPARSSLSCRGSPSSRRAWIEITLELRRRFTTLSPSSRRAWIEIKYNGSMYKEFMVALLAEGVDRNTNEVCCWDYVDKSPSSRRAWIEICYTQ